MKYYQSSLSISRAKSKLPSPFRLVNSVCMHKVCGSHSMCVSVSMLAVYALKTRFNRVLYGCMVFVENAFFKRSGVIFLTTTAFLLPDELLMSNSFYSMWKVCTFSNNS